MESGDITGQVLNVMVAEFPMLGSVGLAADTPLLSAGLLDSFALVTLIAALEEAFDIEIDVENVELEQLETPRSIADLCRGTAVQAGAG